MKQNIYLISEATIKKRSLVTDATLAYLIKPSIEIAQKIGLRQVIGDCMIEKLQYLVSTFDEAGTMLINLDENIAYKHLLQEYVTDYLVYQTMSEMVIPLRDKMRNAGLVNNYDNNYQQPDFNEVTYTKRYWADKAEYFATEMVKYLNENIKAYPEWKDCSCSCHDDGRNGATYDCGIVL